MSEPVAVLLSMHDRLLKEGLMRVLARDDVRAFELARGADPAELAGSERFIMIVGELPGGGLDLPFIGSVKARYPQSLVVLLVDECPADQRWAAEKLGVAGVLLKSISSDTFVASLRLVALGENVFSAPRGWAAPLAPPGDQGASCRPIAGPSDEEAPVGGLIVKGDASGRPEPVLARSPPVALTEMEIKILACLVTGEPSGTIARRFRMTKGAVEASLESILTKTKATSRAQAVLWALHDMDSSELALRIRAATPLPHG